MSYSEDHIKRMAELREWIEGIIKEKEEELERLRFMLTLINNLLKDVSFKPAIMLAEDKEVIQIKKVDQLLANVYIDKDTITIVPASSIKLRTDIVPFKSFFLNKILDTFKNKDLEKVREGKISLEEVLDYKVEEEDSIIKSIMIKNYRDKNRANEIIHACEWVFSKMLERSR